MNKHDRMADLAAKYHDRPIPGVAVRMAIFDSWPKPLRVAIQNMDNMPRWRTLRPIVEEGLRQRWRVETIIARLADQRQPRQVEIDEARVLLKDLGL